MAVEEYYVLLGVRDSEVAAPNLKWNGAVAGAYIGQPGKNKPVKDCKVIAVQAESAAEAITGARQSFPGMSSGPVFAKLKSELNETS